MSTGTTVTLDDDVLEQIKCQSLSRGVSFRNMLNDLLRTALLQQEQKPRSRTLVIKPVSMGYQAGLNHDSTESLLTYGEGEKHRRFSLMSTCCCMPTTATPHSRE